MLAEKLKNEDILHKFLSKGLSNGGLNSLLRRKKGAFTLYNPYCSIAVKHSDL